MDVNGTISADWGNPFQQATPSSREFALQAWQNRRLAFLIASSVFGGSLVLAAAVPAQYKAVAILAVLPAPEFTIRPDAGSREQTATTLALDQVMKAETEILESDDLHLAVLAKLGVSFVYSAPTPGKHVAPFGFFHHLLARAVSIWVAPPIDDVAAGVEQQLRHFRSDLLILPAKDSNIVAISFRSRSPLASAAVINTLLALYAAKRKQLYDDPQLDAIRREKQALEVQASIAEQHLTAFKRRLNISDFGVQRALLLQRVSTAEQALNDVKSLVVEQAARTVSIARQLRDQPVTRMLFEERDPDSRLQLARTALQDLEARTAETTERYTPGSRLIERLRKQLEARRSSVAALAIDNRVSAARSGRNVDRDQMGVDLQHGLTDLAATRSRLKALASQCFELTSLMKDFDQAEPELHALERDNKGAEDNLIGMNKLLSERHLTEAEDALRSANVRVIQPARVPQAASPLPIYIVASGLMLGIVAAGTCITVLFIRRGVFLTEDALAAHFQIPVLATFSLEALESAA